MNKYTIKELKEKELPSGEFISNLFYDWFCSDDSLANRGKVCLTRLRSLVRKCPSKFKDNDTIDIKNCCGMSGIYDCVRVWDEKGDFKYAFVPNEILSSGRGSSYMIGTDSEIVTLKNWNELKKSFCESCVTSDLDA